MGLDELLPVKRFWTGLLPAVAVIAFCVQPALRYGDPDQLVGAGCLTGAGLLGVYVHSKPADVIERVLLVIGAIGLLWGLTGLVAFGLSLGHASRANDRRCLALQRDMLAAYPRKADGPALFQAFGCRPQGDGSVYVPPTKAELRVAVRTPSAPAPVRQDR